jgi:hypothetical protein
VTVIAVMEDQLLALYLPLLGDRIAVCAFCREFDVWRGKVPSKKAQRIDRLREKLNKRHASDSDDDECVQKSRSIYPEKKGKEKKRMKDKTICVCWLHELSDGSFVQVRQNIGGGNRSLQMPVSANKQEILTEAKTIFFPNGLSPLGHQ